MSRPLTRLAGAAVLLFALAGCGGAVTAGSAAVLGDSRITTTEVADQVAEVQRARGQEAGQPDIILTQEVVRRLVLLDLVEQAAARQGVEVTEGEIDAARLQFEAQFGGREALEQAFLDSGVPPSQIDSEIRLNVTATELQAALVPDGTPEEQSAALFDYIVTLSEELGTTIAARFGTWIPADLQVGPPPSDLSVGPQAEPLPLPTEG